MSNKSSKIIYPAVLLFLIGVVVYPFYKFYTNVENSSRAFYKAYVYRTIEDAQEVSLKVKKNHPDDDAGYIMEILCVERLDIDRYAEIQNIVKDEHLLSYLELMHLYHIQEEDGGPVGDYIGLAKEFLNKYPLEDSNGSSRIRSGTRKGVKTLYKHFANRAGTEVLLTLGKIYYDKGDDEAALHYLQMLFDRGKLYHCLEHAVGYPWLAELLIAKNQLKNAKEVLDKYEEEMGYTSQYHIARGKLLVKEKKFAKARYNFKEAMTLDEDYLLGLKEIGRSYYLENNFSKAEELLKQGLNQVKDDPEPYLILAEMALKNHQPESALENLNAYIKQAPEKLNGYEVRIKINVQLNDFEQIWQDSAFLLSMEKTNKYYKEQYYAASMQTGRFMEALSILEQIFKDHKQPGFFLNKGYIYFGAEDYAKANSEFQKCLRHNDYRTTALLWMQICKLRRGHQVNIPRLLSYAKDIVSRKLNHSKIELELIYFLCKKRKIQMLYSCAETDVDAALIAFFLGETFDFGGSSREAEKYYQQAVETRQIYAPVWQLANNRLNKIKKQKNKNILMTPALQH